MRGSLAVLRKVFKKVFKKVVKKAAKKVKRRLFNKSFANMLKRFPDWSDQAIASALGIEIEPVAAERAKMKAG